MSNWKVGPGGRLYHPTTGAYVGQLDDNGNEQMVVTALPSAQGVRLSSPLPEARLSYDRAPAEDVPTVTDPSAPDYSNAIVSLALNSPRFRMFGARVFAQTDGC